MDILVRSNWKQKGEGAIELLLPISRPLPAEGKFGSKGVLVQNLAQVHYSAEGKLKKETGTIEIWFKPLWKSPQKREKEVPYHYHYLFDSRNENYDYGFQIYFWDSGKIGAKKLLCAGWADYNKGDSMSIPVIWQDKRWHHIAFAWKKGEKTAVGKLYLDGKLVDFMERRPCFMGTLA